MTNDLLIKIIEFYLKELKHQKSTNIKSFFGSKEFKETIIREYDNEIKAVEELLEEFK